MPRDAQSHLKELTGVCRQLDDARRRVAELEAKRDDLIRKLRADGVSGAELAAQTGLSAGRVAQITNHYGDHP